MRCTGGVFGCFLGGASQPGWQQAGGEHPPEAAGCFVRVAGGRQPLPSLGGLRTSAFIQQIRQGRAAASDTCRAASELCTTRRCLGMHRDKLCSQEVPFLDSNQKLISKGTGCAPRSTIFFQRSQRDNILLCQPLFGLCTGKMHGDLRLF